MRATVRTVAAALAATLLVASPAPAQDDLEFTSAVPPGALVYLEARDFGGLLGSLAESEFARSFLETRAFGDFTRSKLYNKFADRIRLLQEVTGFSLSVETARQIAGGRSAIALYDIGELRFIFLTRIPMERLALASLWRMRVDFEERQVNGAGYFVKEDPDGGVALAFTLLGDTLVVGSDVNAFEESLRLLSGGGGESLAADERFAEAIPSGFRLEDAAFYLDQERINATPHFRSYWIYRNLEELRSVRRALVGLRFGEDGIAETRWLIAERPPQRPLEEALRIAAALPGDGDLYLFAPTGAADEFAGLLATEMYDDADEELTAGLLTALSGAEPEEYGLAIAADYDEDRFFLSVSRTLVVRLGSPTLLERGALEGALAGYFERKLLRPGLGAFRFADRGGYRVLELPLFGDSVPAYRLDGDLLIIGNDFSSLRAAAAPGAMTPQQEFVAAAGEATSLLNIDAGSVGANLVSYFNTVSQRDNWRSSANAAFFWRNAVSLLESLEFVEGISVVRSREGNREVERVRYSFSR